MATCQFCLKPCGDDVPGAVVFHLACAASSPEMVDAQAGARACAGKRPDPTGVRDMQAIFAAFRSGSMDHWWPTED